MLLSIVIVNYKNPALLRLCIKSLKTAISPDLKYEIIVIDVASTIETRNVVNEEFKDVRLVAYKENIGHIKGFNAGIRESKGEFVLIINPDIVPMASSIESLVELLSKNENIGLAGPELLNFDASHQDSCFRFYSPLTILLRRSFLGKLPFTKNAISKFLMRDKDLSATTEVDWLMGSAIITSKKAIQKIGLYDENYFMYMGDIDWARRFWENGYSVVYYPLAKMYHYHQRTSKGQLGLLDFLFKKETRWHIGDAIKYFKKYGIKLPQLKINYGTAK